MSWISKAIGRDKAKETEAKADRAIDEAAAAMGASGEKLKALLEKLAEEAQSQTKNDYEARKFFENKVSTFIAQLPLQNEQARQRIFKSLGESFNTNFEQRKSTEQDIATRLRDFISQQSKDVTGGLTSNIGTQEASTRDALNKFLSGETSRQAALGVTQAGARGFEPGGSVFNSWMADKLAGLENLRFGTEQGLASSRADILNRNLTNQSDITRALELGLADKESSLAGDLFSGKMGLAQGQAGMTREDQLAQQQMAFNNYLNQFNTRASDYALSRGTSNALKYQAPFDVQKQLNDLLLGVQNVRVSQAQQRAQNAAQNYQGTVNAIGSTVGNAISTLLFRGSTGLGNKMGLPKDDYSKMFEQYMRQGK